MNYISFLLVSCILSTSLLVGMSNEQLTLYNNSSISSEEVGFLVARSSHPLFDKLCFLSENDAFNTAFEQLLSENPAMLMHQPKKCPSTLLHRASYKNAIKNVRTILKIVDTFSDTSETNFSKENLVTRRDFFGYNALHLAIANNNPALVELLLQEGCPPVNVKKNRKKITSAVHLALNRIDIRPRTKNRKQIYKNLIDVKKRILWLLCTYGAKVNAKNNRGVSTTEFAKRNKLHALGPHIKHIPRFFAFERTLEEYNKNNPSKAFPYDIITLIAPYLIGQNTLLPQRTINDTTTHAH